MLKVSPVKIKIQLFLRCLIAGFRTRFKADHVPVQNLPVLQQSASVFGLPRAAVWDCGGEPGDEAGNQVVIVQKSPHSDGGGRAGKKLALSFGRFFFLCIVLVTNTDNDILMFCLNVAPLYVKVMLVFWVHAVKFSMLFFLCSNSTTRPSSSAPSGP